MSNSRKGIAERRGNLGGRRKFMQKRPLTCWGGGKKEEILKEEGMWKKREVGLDKSRTK